MRNITQRLSVFGAMQTAQCNAMTNPNPNPNPNLLITRHLRCAICIAPFALRRIQIASHNGMVISYRQSSKKMITNDRRVPTLYAAVRPVTERVRRRQYVYADSNDYFRRTIAIRKPTKRTLIEKSDSSILE